MDKKTLLFKDFTVNHRQYYTSEFKLTKVDRNTTHTHDFYEVLVILEGEFIEHTPSKNFFLKKRTVHFVKPSDKHHLSTTGKYETNLLRNIALDAVYFLECLKEVGITHTDNLFNPFELDTLAYQNYRNKVDLLLQLNNSEATNHFLVKSILSDLFIHSLLTQDQRTDTPSWLKKVYLEMYKEENYVAGLPQLIHLSGKTQEHLTRAFKKYYHITPSDHINNIRLQAAASLLTTSDKKIIDIIYECGFNNISYFNRLFKRKFGVQPSVYQDYHKNIFDISI